MMGFRIFLAVPTLVLMAGCGANQPQGPVIGEVFAGPSQLELRKEILPSSPVVANVKHGEKLEIVQVRRKFFKLRTPWGAEGWTHERSLLSKAEVDELTKLRQSSAKQHSQGTALFSQRTNVHTEPVRASPSFTQIEENEKVAVLLHRITPRAAEGNRKSLLPPPKPKPARKKKAVKEKKHVDLKGNPLPPFPKAPQPPADWIELSRSRTFAPELEVPAEPAPPKPAGPQVQPMDEWSLVRRSNGDAGWVLRSRLMFDLPDYILQHAEGKRITSCFILGQIQDKEGKPKPVYLWTTVSSRYADHDFDLMRLFFWNVRRERYETGYIERNMRGFLPIVLQVVNAPKSAQPGDKLQGLTFEAEKDGQRVRRSYAYLGDRLRFVGQEPVTSAPGVSGLPPTKAQAPEPKPQPAPSWFAQVTRRIAYALGGGGTGSAGL
jgi:hypothetical protein